MKSAVNLSATQVVLTQRAWQAVSGFLTAILVTKFLSSFEQGYFYAIGSLLSLWVLFDLGLNGLLVQISARMFSGLYMGDGGKLRPGGSKKSAFIAMVLWCRWWYSRISFLSLVLVPAGFIYFLFSKDSVESINWQMPWIFAVIAVAFSISSSPMLSIIEGAGRVAEVYWIRLIYYALGAALAWILIAFGFGLYALAMPPLALSLTTVVWFRLRYYKLIEMDEPEQIFSWRENVLPLQKRVALSWFSGYVFLNVPVLIVFYFLDAVSAGQIGLTSVIANVLGSFCASGLIAVVPQMTDLASRTEVSEARILFLKEFKKSLFLMLLGYSAVVFLIIAIRHWSLAERFLPPLEAVLLFAAFTIFHSISMFSLYFRACGKERLAYHLGLAIALSSVFSCMAVQSFGVTGVIIVFLGFLSVICAPPMIIFWIKNRQASCF